jgi:hypothetical protein
MSTPTSVPVKIDASALADAISTLQQNAQSAVEYIQPAPVIALTGDRMCVLYDRLAVLNELASHLSGKKMADPLPESLNGLKLTISLAEKSVDVFNVACIKDLASLISTEIGVIIFTLEAEARRLADIVTKTAEACTQARTRWVADHPDLKVSFAGPAAAALDTNAAANTEHVSAKNVPANDRGDQK